MAALRRSIAQVKWKYIRELCLSARQLSLAGLTALPASTTALESNPKNRPRRTAVGDNRGSHPPCDMPRSERCRIRGNCLDRIALLSLAQAPVADGALRVGRAAPASGGSAADCYDFGRIPAPQWSRFNGKDAPIAIVNKGLGGLLPELPHGQSYGLRIGLARGLGDDALVVQPHIGTAPETKPHSRADPKRIRHVVLIDPIDARLSAEIKISAPRKP